MNHMKTRHSKSLIYVYYEGEGSEKAYLNFLKTRFRGSAEIKGKKGFYSDIERDLKAQQSMLRRLWDQIGEIWLFFFLGRTLCLLFLNQSQTAALDAAALYLRRMGYLFWVLGPLNVFRMSMQGMSFANRAMFAGVMEMAARTFVSLVFVSFFGFDAITWTDQSAWVSATLYAMPMCLHSLKQVKAQFEKE